MIGYKTRVLYNTQYETYGNMFIISSKYVKSVNTLLSFVIVGLYPVPLALWINRFIKDLKVRYEVIRRWLGKCLIGWEWLVFVIVVLIVILYCFGLIWVSFKMKDTKILVTREDAYTLFEFMKENNIDYEEV